MSDDGTIVSDAVLEELDEAQACPGYVPPEADVFARVHRILGRLSSEERAAALALLTAEKVWRTSSPVKNSPSAQAMTAAERAKRYRESRKATKAPVTEAVTASRDVVTDRNVTVSVTRDVTVRDARASLSSSSDLGLFSNSELSSLDTDQGNSARANEKPASVTRIKAPSRKKPVGTPIDADAEPDDKAKDFAQKRSVNWRVEWPKFVAYHQKEGTLSKNWAASWRYWVLRSPEFAPTKGRPVPQNDSSAPKPCARCRKPTTAGRVCAICRQDEEEKLVDGNLRLPQGVLGLVANIGKGGA